MATTRRKSRRVAETPGRLPVGSAIGSLRRNAGVAQEDLGLRLGITRVGVSHYESGKTIPMYGQVRRMLSYLGLDLHDLQDALDHREGRPLRVRSVAERQPGLEEVFLAETEALFRRWARRVPAAQRPRLEKAEAEVMELMREVTRELHLRERAQ